MKKEKCLSLENRETQEKTIFSFISAVSGLKKTFSTVLPAEHGVSEREGVTHHLIEIDDLKLI